MIWTVNSDVIMYTILLYVWKNNQNSALIAASTIFFIHNYADKNVIMTAARGIFYLLLIKGLLRSLLANCRNALINVSSIKKQRLWYKENPSGIMRLAKSSSKGVLQCLLDHFSVRLTTFFLRLKNMWQNTACQPLRCLKAAVAVEVYIPVR
jgi:hypothetical protein